MCILAWVVFCFIVKRILKWQYNLTRLTKCVRNLYTWHVYYFYNSVSIINGLIVLQITTRGRVIYIYSVWFLLIWIEVKWGKKAVLCWSLKWLIIRAKIKGSLQVSAWIRTRPGYASTWEGGGEQPGMPLPANLKNPTFGNLFLFMQYFIPPLCLDIAFWLMEYIQEKR